VTDTQSTQTSQAMELDLLERRIRRLVAKLEKVCISVLCMLITYLFISDIYFYECFCRFLSCSILVHVA